jgi:hypothetical protein
MMKHLLVAFFGVFALGVAYADHSVAALDPAERIDSGLGELAHYSQWQEPWCYAMPAESIDSGLGETPDASRMVEVWLYAHPAEKIDNGLGDIAHAVQQSQHVIASTVR